MTTDKRKGKSAELLDPVILDSSLVADFSSLQLLTAIWLLNFTKSRMTDSKINSMLMKLPDETGKGGMFDFVFPSIEMFQNMTMFLFGF